MPTCGLSGPPPPPPPTLPVPEVPLVVAVSMTSVPLPPRPRAVIAKNTGPNRDDLLQRSDMGEDIALSISKKTSAREALPSPTAGRALSPVASEDRPAAFEEEKNTSNPAGFVESTDLDFAAAGMLGMVAFVLERRTKGGA